MLSSAELKQLTKPSFLNLSIEKWEPSTKLQTKIRGAVLMQKKRFTIPDFVFRWHFKAAICYSVLERMRESGEVVKHCQRVNDATVRVEWEVVRDPS